MSVNDVIKKSILESDMYNQAISMSTLFTIAVDLIVALIMGLVIYAVYKKFFSGVIFSRSYAITLVGMTVLTCMVTLAISTNIIISLGMVGALSYSSLPYGNQRTTGFALYVLGNHHGHNRRSQHVYFSSCGCCHCHFYDCNIWEKES